VVVAYVWDARDRPVSKSWAQGRRDAGLGLQWGQYLGDGAGQRRGLNCSVQGSGKNTAAKEGHHMSCQVMGAWKRDENFPSGKTQCSHPGSNVMGTVKRKKTSDPTAFSSRRSVGERKEQP